MAAEKNELARLTARDGTHDFAHSASVAAGLMALEKRYGFKVTEEEREVVVNEQLHKVRALAGDGLNDRYQACHQEMFRALELAKEMPEFAHLQPLIARMEAKLPAVFPETMVSEAYQWEQLDNIVLNPATGETGSRIFPLHYVFMVVWTALNDDVAFIDNYSPGADKSALEQAQADRSHRLLTFFKTMDENIQDRTCSQGARNALVLCLNKIHPDVAMIEDMDIALKAEFLRLLSEYLSRYLDDLSEERAQAVQAPLLAWIQDDSGALGSLPEALGLNPALALTGFLLHHGIPLDEKVKSLMNTVITYQAPSVELSEYPGISKTVHALNFLVNETNNLEWGAQAKPNYLKDLRALIGWINSEDNHFVSDTAQQELLILTAQLVQGIDFLSKEKTLLSIMGLYSDAEIEAQKEQAVTYLQQCIRQLSANKLEALEPVRSFVEALLGVEQKALKDSGKAFIANFFALWSQGMDWDNKHLRHPLYRFVWSRKDLVLLSDAALQTLINQSARNGETHFSPYEINRVLLHALMTPVEQWSDLFTQVFEKTLSLIKPQSSDSAQVRALKASSYQPTLIEQLEMLGRLQKGNSVLVIDVDLVWMPFGTVPVQTTSQLLSVLYSIPLELFVPFVKSLNEHKAVIKTVEDFAEVLKDLSPRQITVFVACMQDQLPALIETTKDFVMVLWGLDAEQITVLVAGMQDQLPELIKTAQDFGAVLAYLNPEHRGAFFQSMQNQLPGLIKMADDFARVLSMLNSEQITTLVACMQDQLPGLIKAADDFARVLNKLNSQQITAFVACMQGQLLKTADDFARVLEYLNPGQRTDILHSMQGQLAALLKTADDFARVLEYLNPGQRADILHSMQGQLAALIKTAEDFARVLRYLTWEQTAEILYGMQDQLPGLIKTAEDFENVFQYLNPRQMEEILYGMQDQLPGLIKTAEDFLLTLCCIYQGMVSFPEEIASQFIVPILSLLAKEKPGVFFEILKTDNEFILNELTKIISSDSWEGIKSHLSADSLNQLRNLTATPIASPYSNAFFKGESSKVWAALDERFKEEKSEMDSATKPLPNG